MQSETLDCIYSILFLGHNTLTNHKASLVEAMAESIT